MKRLFLLFIFVLFFISVVFCAPSRFKYNTFEGVEMTFSWESGKTCGVGANFGNWYSQAINSSTTGTITIPTKAKWYAITDSLTVNRIEKEAFKNCSHITKVILPESIAEPGIGDEAFSGCTSLTEINIPEGASIGYYAFKGCTSLSSISFLPTSLTRISQGMFEGCTGLTSITIPSGITSIGNGAFKDCTGLTSITIPSGVTSIGDNAFKGCTGLTSITIPSTVTNIGANAFEGCIGLTSITISGGNITIGANAFDGCTNIETVNISGFGTVGNRAFQNCTKLHSVSFDDGLINIGEYCFNQCTQLSSVHMNDCIATIGSSAFNGCSKLEDVTWSSNLTSIGNYAFQNCTSLKTICIPAGMSSMNLYSFRNCGQSKLEITIEDHDGDLSISNASYFQTLKPISIYLGRNIVTPGVNGDFRNNTSLTKLEIGGNATQSHCFAGCTKLSEVVLHDGVESITGSAFYGCSNLTSIELPNSITTIGSYAFEGTGLTSIEIPNSVTTIGQSAFAGLGLTSIEIPNSVTIIGPSAFEACPSLASIEISGNVSNIESWTFRNCSSLNSVILPNSVVSIGSEAFRGCSSLTSIVIPDDVTTIGISAFRDCQNLTSINLPEGINSLDTGIFYGCTALTSITGGSNVISVGENCFYNCSALESIGIGKKLEEIGNSAFYGCAALSSLVASDCLRTIGERAFYNCTSLEEFVIPATTESIGDRAFRCGNLQNIYSKIKEPFAVPEYTFLGLSSSAILHVPYDKKSLYQGLSGWSQYIPNIVEESVNVGDTFNADFNSDNTYYTGIHLVKSVEPFTAFLGAGSAAVSGSVKDLEIPVTVTGGDGTVFSITGISNDAFHHSSISSLFIPASIKNIEDGAFANCSSLDSVTVLWRVPSNVETAEDCFDGISDEAVLYIPAGTKERYEAIDTWSGFSQIIESSPISTGDISARYGSKADLPIYLRNTESISGLQFKLTLPEGVTVVDHESNLVTSTTERTEGFTIMGRKDPDEENSYLFVVLSLNGDAISGTEGAFMNVRLDIAQNVGLGVHDIKIEDVYMTTETFDTLNPAESTSELTVKDFMLGDVNNDGIINITDAIGIINYVLKNTPETFIEGAADVNQDGIINVTDAIGVINKILN